MPLGLKIKIGNEEKDLDDIFLKITDYNNSVTNNERETGEAVVLTQNTGIKYIDETGVKRDLIYRYIGYDSEGYIAANYEADPNRIDASNLNAITDICGNNLVNLFYQLGTKKLATNEYKTYQIHNKNKRVDFEMGFLQDVDINVEANLTTNTITMKYNSNNIITINGTTISTDLSQTVIQLKNINTITQSHDKLKFFIEGILKLNLGTSGTTTYTFNKDTV
jgi:hypothetical protein